MEKPTMILSTERCHPIHVEAGVTLPGDYLESVSELWDHADRRPSFMDDNEGGWAADGDHPR